MVNSGAQFSPGHAPEGDYSHPIAYGLLMYTGIIQQIGLVASIEQAAAGIRLSIDPVGWDYEPKPGDSVANNGCCLTLITP
ncbi:MAG: hypothetical protein ACWA5W_05005, partial [Phycisphaerales bacterium]